jgi:hypothetical protein
VVSSFLARFVLLLRSVAIIYALVNVICEPVRSWGSPP